MKSTTLKTLLNVFLVGISLLSLKSQAGVVVTYIHNDALGTPVAGTDEQGNVKWRAHYQPYGEELLGERQLFGVRTGYTGHRDDPETGLTYMGARYYSPALGRFMGVDPAGVDVSNIHSFNRYAYANNNPYKYIDPDGGVAFIPVIIWAGGAAAFIGDIFFPEPVQLDEFGDAPLQRVSTLPGPLGTFKKTVNAAEDFGGSLTQLESKEIQAIADRFKTKIDVIGSRAAGKGRNINDPDLPVGKGPGTRSDIDIRIDGQVDIDTGGALSDAIRRAGNGAGRVSSSTGLPSKPPAIEFRSK